MGIPTPKEAIDSIIAWTDCEGLPDDPKQRLEYYARRMLLIRNAARTVQMATDIEFPGALERNDLGESMFKMKFMDGSVVPQDYARGIAKLINAAANGDPGELDEAELTTTGGVS